MTDPLNTETGSRARSNFGNAGDFRPWKLQWEPMHIHRFWDYYGTKQGLAENYFSNLAGRSILKQVGGYVPLCGTVVDFGTGPGYLVDLLLDAGASVLATDPSRDSIDLLNRRLNGRPNFLGGHHSSLNSLPLSSSIADVVMLVEVVEHLREVDTPGVLAEVRRISRPGGHVVITTPHDEDLSQLEIMCPSCGCVFHSMQHVRSFTASSLTEVMERAGFRTLVCKPTLFLPKARIGAFMLWLRYDPHIMLRALKVLAP